MNIHKFDSTIKCERCHRAGTGQTTLEVIGSKLSYTLKWCKPNNDDDDDDGLEKRLKKLNILDRPRAVVDFFSPMTIRP